MVKFKVLSYTSHLYTYSKCGDLQVYLSNVEITYDIPTNYVKQAHNPVICPKAVSAYKRCFTYFKPNKVGIKYENNSFPFFHTF